jgi:hypothetical protein
MKQFQLILLVAVILIPACTIPAKIELYNNSGEPITVEIDNDSLLISPNTTASFGQDYGIVFSIKTNGPFTKRVFRAQFEANGFIWAVGPEQEYPVTNFIDQPEGFPVEPGKV